MAPEQNERKTTAGLEANATASSGKFPFWIIVLIIIVALAGGGYYYYTHRTPSTGGKQRIASPFRTNPDMAIPVQAATAQSGAFEVYLEALGTVTAAQTVVVHSRVDGQLMALHFKEGDSVKAGALLAEIDPRPFQVVLTQAEGQMARDKAQLENAKLDLQRYRVLLKQDSVSQQQVDTQEALVAQNEGLVKYDQGQIDSAKLNLDYSRITAPISGRLGLRQVDIGNMVRASDTNGIVVITQEEPIDVMFTLAEGDLPKVVQKVYAGAKFPVEAWDRAQKTLLERGTLMTVDNQIDVTTGTVKLKARFNNKNHVMFPNQFVNVRMKIDTLQNVLLIPSAAVQRGSVGTFVYVIGDEEKVSVRQVTPSNEDEGEQVIGKGLAAGERVVIDGTDRLREGSTVEVTTLDGKQQTLPEPGKRAAGKDQATGGEKNASGQAASGERKGRRGQKPPKEGTPPAQATPAPSPPTRPRS
ncbi:MAG: MdtA/MuxA family multidrug efflux RND transporter periplasmic adaptor subunit [Burkholderiales bacterium]|jgi:multidrug efflux system membrane fusion protein|nr:MdtA/MuxA family multidrug efflux RND transporter periplasmic adaptor subunit [Burkholderiales bacterium]